jgi:Uma2 family endonuclease
MSTRTLQTFEQFEQFQDDGMKHELLRGEHIVVPPAKSRHSSIQHNLLHLLWPYVKQHQLGDVRIETGFKLSSDTWLQPDVSFLRSTQIQAADPDGYLEGSPALAIEVVSDSNTPARLNLKTELYFAHGSEEVWIVYPKTGTVQIHYPNGNSQTVAEGELRSDLFAGWSTPVDSCYSTTESLLSSS